MKLIIAIIKPFSGEVKEALGSVGIEA